MPKIEKIRGLNLPGTPRATSACCGITLLYFAYECVFVALVIQHAMLMRLIILLSVVCLAVLYFSALYHKWQDIWEKPIEYKIDVF